VGPAAAGPTCSAIGVNLGAETVWRLLRASKRGRRLTIRSEKGKGVGNLADMENAAVHGQSDLNRLAVSATTHCLTGCAIGEFSGMAIGTALGWENLPTTVLAIVLAYFFGFALTAMPLVRAGLAAGAVVSTALAADTISITIMEVIDNLAVILIPGAMDAGLGDFLFYGSIAAGFAIAYPFAFLANRYMIARGKGHAVVHEYH
jgi:hypothetical protein